MQNSTTNGDKNPPRTGQSAEHKNLRRGIAKAIAEAAPLVPGDTFFDTEIRLIQEENDLPKHAVVIPGTDLAYGGKKRNPYFSHEDVQKSGLVPDGVTMIVGKSGNMTLCGTPVLLKQMIMSARAQSQANDFAR